MTKPYMGDADLNEVLRLTGADAFEGRGRDRGSLRNYRYDSVLSETMQPFDAPADLFENAVALTDTEVAAELQSKLAPLLAGCVWRVRAGAEKFLTKVSSVTIDVYSYSPDKSTWVSGILENAPNQLRLSIQYWESGEPVVVRFGDTEPSGGVVELRVVHTSGDVQKQKPRQMKATPEKVVASVVKWFKQNAALFTNTPKSESAWQDAFPSVNPVDDFSSWAAARDDKNDLTPPGVMGEAKDTSPAKLVLDLDYHPDKAGGRITIGGGASLEAQQSVLAAVQQELDTAFGNTAMKRIGGEWILRVTQGQPRDLVTALRVIGKKLGLSLGKTLGEQRELTLEELAAGVPRQRATTRASTTPSLPPRTAVAQLEAMLRKLQG